MRKFAALLALLAVLFMAGCATQPAAQAAPAAPQGPAPLASEVSITILHTNDMHARGLETANEIGYSRIAGYAAAVKAKNPNTLILDAGDVLHGLPWANLERGAPVVALMNAVGYDAMSPGNHDFNYGFDRLVELSKTMKFPVLAANVYKGGEQPFAPYTIKNVGGVRVAIVGLATQETAYKSDPAGLKGVFFEQPVAEARRVINEIEGKYDVLVGLVHIGVDGSSNPVSLALARSMPEFDVIIDGHSHTSLAKMKELNKTDVLMVSADANGVTLGRVDLVVGKDRKVAKKEAVSLTMKANAAELVSDPAVKKLADEISAAQKPMLAEVVGKTEILLEGTREIVRTSESNLGRLIASGMLATTGADVALMNGGGIRTSIPAGDITKGQVYSVLPFGNYLWTTQVTGAELKAILENGVSKLPAADGRYPHLAGATFTFDATQPAGSRVTGITVKGKAVDFADAKTKYTLATLNFLMAGGDGYAMLVGRSYKEFPIDADSFMNQVKKLGTITAANAP